MMKTYGKKNFFIFLILIFSSFALYAPVQQTLFNQNLLQILLDDFKKYKTTNSKAHSGDLYEHSIWDSNTTADWWLEKKFWVEGIDPKYRIFTIYASLLHDIGKGGDLVYEYKAKKDHPIKGFDYLTGKVPYLLDSSGKKFDFNQFFKGHDEFRKMMAIIIGMHWDFGRILKELAEGKDEQELLDNYFKLMEDLAKKVGYNNGKINEQLLRMSILISAADIRGADYVSSKNNILGLPNVPPTHPVKIDPYTKYKLEQRGKELREDILNYFKEIQLQPTIAKPKTQTEALLSIPYIRFLVKKLYGPTFIKNQSMIKQMIARELEYAPTHFVFYHGANISQFVLFEVIKSLYKLYYPHTHISEESFQALRTPYAQLFDQFKTIRDFTENQINYHTEIHDTPITKRDFLIQQLTGKKVTKMTKNEIKKAEKKLAGKIDWTIPAHLLSVNLSLFGNIGKNTLSECTFDYFAADKRRKAASLASIYKSILQEFGITESYIPSFEALATTIASDVGVIYQIFIPKNKVNDIVYLARDYGKPYGSPTALGYLFNRNIPKEKRLPEFWKMLDKNPELLLEKPKSVEEILTQYKLNPTSIPNINRLQARILMTNNQLLNPSSGTKIFVYTGLTPTQLTAFRKKLDSLTHKAFKEFLQKNITTTKEVSTQTPA